MAENTDNKPQTSVAAKAGPLKSTLTLQLHTRYAILLWEGRSRDKATGKPTIVSMPQVIARARKISLDASNNNPYADNALWLLEQALEISTARLHKAVTSLDIILSNLPSQLTLSTIASISPLNIGVFSRTPVGYRCVWLLVGFDQLAMKAFQAWHYGLISRKKRDEFLRQGGHWVRQVYGVAQQYRSVAVTREDLYSQTRVGIEAIALLGQPDTDIMNGTKRSLFSPPLIKATKGMEEA